MAKKSKEQEMIDSQNLYEEDVNSFICKKTKSQTICINFSQCHNVTKWQSQDSNINLSDFKAHIARRKRNIYSGRREN